MISKYFQNLGSCFQTYEHIVEDYFLNKQTFTREKGAIDGEIYFNNGTRLVFLEVLDASKTTKQKYSYHYMNQDNQMLFRYDNAKHFPKIKTFPHHKHTQNGVIESQEPNINQILIEIEKIY